MIPRVAHFVFGLEEQQEPFHFANYVAIESCRRVLTPERIYFHHQHLPWGPWWELVAPHVTLAPVEPVAEVLAADYSDRTVPSIYRYAHHADFIRLDALIEHGGVYADIDTVFVRPPPEELFSAPFVIGREPPVRDERSGEPRPSLCNAFLMAAPGAQFAREWRARMPSALNGTWSNHSGFLAYELSESMPEAVRVEPDETFFPFPATRTGLAQLFEERHPLPDGACSIHLWSHLWWERRRRDFSDAHAGWCTPRFLRHAQTTFAELARSYLPTALAGEDRETWSYLSLDEDSGYGIAADRCMSALESSGLDVDWTPLVREDGQGYAPARQPSSPAGRVVVAHAMPEYFVPIRQSHPDAFLVGHTVWETDRLPAHWIAPLGVVDLVVVPSSFCAQVFAAAPGAAPVAVVPHVAPPALRGGAAPPEIAPDVFVFYTIAEWTTRKAVFHTIRTYLDTFTARDRVLLIVKTSGYDHTGPLPRHGHAVGPGMTSWALARLIAGRREAPAIRLVAGTMRSEDILALHRRGDCFVSLCRSEGWGIGAFDAASYGTPVLTTGWGGHLDYLGDSPYLVDYELTAVVDPLGEPSYTPDQRWAEPKLDHASALMRQIAADPEPARAWAAAKGEEIRRRFRPEAVATALRAAVEERMRG
jgi:glycosyltransferase involved in cell wall biosynthesis